MLSRSHCVCVSNCRTMLIPSATVACNVDCLETLKQTGGFFSHTSKGMLNRMMWIKG